MKITDIQLIQLNYPLERPVKMSFGLRWARKHLFVKVLTDTHIYGIGEAWTNFPEWGAEEKKLTLSYLKNIFIGKDPLKINDIWLDIERAVFDSAAGLQYGAKGPLYQSLSGVDIALYDIRGKAEGLPVYRLLGGAKHDHIPAYSSGLVIDVAREVVEKCLADGFTRFKAKIGFGFEEDGAQLNLIRQLAPSCELYVDANQKWKDAETAAKELKLLSEYNIAFAEEPLKADDLDGYRALKNMIGIPLACGENLYDMREYDAFLKSGVADIIQPDVTKCGGITRALMVNDLAKCYHKPLALHMFSTAICMAASLNVMFASEQAAVMESDMTGNAMMTDLLSKRFYALSNGRYEIAEEIPGIGIELNEEFCEKYGVK